MLSLKHIRFAVLCLALLFAAQLVLRAQAPAVSASATNVQAADDHATLNVALTNTGDSDVTNAWVVFADHELYVGDVAAGKTTTSDATTVDLSNAPPSHNVPVSVTLRYDVGGSTVQAAGVLVVTR